MTRLAEELKVLKKEMLLHKKGKCGGTPYSCESCYWEMKERDRDKMKEHEDE